MIILFENVVSSICINLATSALSSWITAHAQDEPISYFNRKKTLAWVLEDGDCFGGECITAHRWRRGLTRGFRFVVDREKKRRTTGLASVIPETSYSSFGWSKNSVAKPVLPTQKSVFTQNSTWIGICLDDTEMTSPISIQLNIRDWRRVQNCVWLQVHGWMDGWMNQNDTRFHVTCDCS